MNKSLPHPRRFPKIGGFSLPHMELRGDVHACLERLALAREAADEKSAAFRASGDETSAILASASLDAQMYSRAAQVFSAMTMEGALNCYGLMWFGESRFERKIGNLPTIPKLRALIEYTTGAKVKDDSEIVEVARRLMAKRTAHVHPRTVESSPDASGAFQRVSRQPQSRRDPRAALESAADLDQFLTLFAHLNAHTATFFDPRFAVVAQGESRS